MALTNVGADHAAAGSDPREQEKNLLDLLRMEVREGLSGLDQIGDEPVVFEPEYVPVNTDVEEPYTVSVEDGVYVVEGPRIEKMLGYTNLESEKGFDFFQKFLKENGILDDLEQAGIQEGDTVRMYGLEFDYYK